MLTLTNISAAYRKDNLILEKLNLSIAKGQRTAVLGRNGAGKSTLVKSIMGLVPIRSGDILFEGRKINDVPVYHLVKLGIGYFHQGGQVFPQMSIEENLRFASFKNPEVKKSTLEAMKHYFPVLNSPKVKSLKAGDLSGGERTQLALAMVFLNKPKLLILDEPFAGISPKNADLIFQFMQDSADEWNYTLLLIEQNQYLAKRLCNEVFVLKQRQLISFQDK